MKIFVAYGYTQESSWIRELVYPLIESFDAKVLHGEDVQGEIITQTVRDKIGRSDALIGFLTKREKIENQNYYTTHRWVYQELATAANSNKLWLEVREENIDPQLGMTEGVQYITFTNNQKEVVLIELAKTLSKWKQRSRKQRIGLIPPEIAQEIYQHLNDPLTSCTYRFMNDQLNETQELPAKLYKYGEVLCINVRDFPEEDNSLINITVRTKGGSYSTNFQSAELPHLQLSKF